MNPLEAQLLGLQRQIDSLSQKVTDLEQRKVLQQNLNRVVIQQNAQQAKSLKVLERDFEERQFWRIYGDSAFRFASHVQKETGETWKDLIAGLKSEKKDHPEDFRQQRMHLLLLCVLDRYGCDIDDWYRLKAVTERRNKLMHDTRERSVDLFIGDRLELARQGSRFVDHPTRQTLDKVLAGHVKHEEMWINED